MHTDLPAHDELPDLVVRTDGHSPVLEIPDHVDFSALKDWLASQLESRHPDLRDRTARLDLGERPIQLFDLRRLIHHVRERFDLEITGIYVSSDAVYKYAERELKLKLFVQGEPPAAVAAAPAPAAPKDTGVLPGIEELRALKDELAPATLQPLPEEPEDPSEPLQFGHLGTAIRRSLPPIATVEDDEQDDPTDSAEFGTLTVRRTLRSGASLDHGGDLVVFGDVNPGAQIVAGGNIVVMGSLRGVAHAGARGDEDAFILAFELRPTQVRIAGHIAIDPSGPSSSDTFRPELASVHDGTIVIEPYNGRLRR